MNSGDTWIVTILIVLGLGMIPLLFQKISADAEIRHLKKEQERLQREYDETFK
jgi:hypothetical protein